MKRLLALTMSLTALAFGFVACDDGDTGPSSTADAGTTTNDVLSEPDTPASSDTPASPETAVDAASPAPTHSGAVGAILSAKCTGCHTGGGSGGHDIGSTASDAAKSASSPSCAGLTVAECAIKRIKDGTMPIGGGCSGDPATDSGNSACLTADEQATVQAWVDAGAPE